MNDKLTEAIDRAKSYVSKLAEEENNLPSNIDLNKIWQLKLQINNWCTTLRLMLHQTRHHICSQQTCKVLKQPRGNSLQSDYTFNWIHQR